MCIIIFGQVAKSYNFVNKILCMQKLISIMYHPCILNLNVFLSVKFIITVNSKYIHEKY